MRDFFESPPDFLSINEGFFRKPTSPPLPLREGPPLISVFSPQGRRGNRPTRCSNRFAIRLADHQRSSPAAELHFAVCDRMDTNRLQAAWCLLEVFSKTHLDFLSIKRLFSKITPSLFTIKEGSTSFPKPFFSWRRLAALGNLKASFHCTHLHNLSPQGTRDVPTVLLGAQTASL